MRWQSELARLITSFELARIADKRSAILKHIFY